MKRKHIGRLFLISVIFITILCSFIIFNKENAFYESNPLLVEDTIIMKDVDEEYQENKTTLLTSFNGQIPLNYSNIIRNVSRPIRRYFESVNFTVNVAGFASKGANKTKIQFLFNNGISTTFDMDPIGSDFNKTWTYTYASSYSTPLGFHEVRFLIYNETLLLNTGTTLTNFTIISNALAYLNATTLNIGNTLKADFIFNQSIDSWNISIVDDDDRTITFQKFLNPINPYQILVDINKTFSANELYYIKINSTQGARWIDEYFAFYIENTDPIIMLSTVRFSSNSIFRGKSTDIFLNVSDNENSPSNIDVSIAVEDPEGESEIIILDNNNDGSFEGTISTSVTQPIGNYDVEISAEDSFGRNDTYNVDFKVKNNPPTINGYKINNQTVNESITVQYGELLTFTFNVSDLEGISLVTVSLVNEQNEYYNISSEYIENMNLTVRTVDLSTGSWFVYVNITDTNGVNVGLTEDYLLAPKEIIIEINPIEEFFPIAMLIIGLTIGGLLGIGIVMGFFKTRLLKRKEVLMTQEKKEPKAIKKKLSGVKGKISDKKTEEKLEKELEEKKTEQKVEKVEDTTKKRIRRKL